MDKILDSLENVNDASMPLWARLLIDSMVLVIKELKCVSDLARRIEELESYKKINESTSESLCKENKRLNDRLTFLETTVHDHEQRNRTFCLLLHGIEEDSEENTDTVVVDTIRTELGIENIALANLQRSHRLGPPRARNNTRATRTNNPPKPRPIIIRFRDFSVRQEIFRNKRKLKGKGISISESLTKKRYALYKLALSKFGRGNVWTTEGRITTKIDNNYVVIMSEADLQ